MKQRKIGKVVLLSSIGLVSYSGFLIANMPVQKFWQYLPTDRLPVQPAGIDGTPWKGSAESVTLTVSNPPLVLPAIRWQIHSGSLLEGELSIALELGNAASMIEGKGDLAISQQMLTLENVELNTTAQWLLSATGLAASGQLPGELKGNLFLELDKLTLNDTGCLNVSGNAELINSQLASPFGQFDLGNSNAELRCQNQKLVARVTQKSAIINSYGDLQLGINGRYTFTAKVTPDSTLPDTMKEGFSLLGKPDSSGAYPLRFRGIIL